MNNHPIGGPCRLCGRPNIEHGNGQCPTMTMTQLAPHQQRVVTERDELAERLSKLFAFFSSPVFAALPAAEQTRLRSQARFMDGYLLVLNERIEAFSAPHAADLDALVARFLTWPVPAEVYPDGTPGQPGRTGTNLLSAPQAAAMLRHVLVA